MISRSFDYTEIQANPKLGASWEGFALECVWRSIGKPDDDAYVWAAHTGAAVDLLWQQGGALWACEIKYADAPAIHRSMMTALADLKLHKLWVIYPGNRRYRLHEKIEVLPLAQVPARWEY